MYVDFFRVKILTMLDEFEIAVEVGLNVVRDNCEEILAKYQRSTTNADVTPPNLVQLEHSQTLDHTVGLTYTYTVHVHVHQEIVQRWFSLLHLAVQRHESYCGDYQKNSAHCDRARYKERTGAAITENTEL